MKRLTHEDGFEWYRTQNQNRKIYEKLKYYEDLEEQGGLVEVTRCKDCKCFEEVPNTFNYYFCKRFGGLVSENDYCSRSTVELRELELES